MKKMMLLMAGMTLVRGYPDRPLTYTPILFPFSRMAFHGSFYPSWMLHYTQVSGTSAVAEL